MLSTILSAFTVAEIRKKLAFTALLLALYRHEVLGAGAFDLAPEQLDSLVTLKRRGKR